VINVATERTTPQYNWDAGWNLLNEEDGSGNLTRTFFHDPGKPIGTMLAHVDGTAPSTTDFLYYFQDNIGSTTQLRNEDNTFAGDYEYTPYGQSWHAGGATTDHQFTGKYHDTKADLYYFPYRHYNPSLARWTTPDPLGMVDGPNMYSYVRNNPANLFDPDGRFAFIMSVLAAAIVRCIVGGGIFAAVEVVRQLMNNRKPRWCETTCQFVAGCLAGVFLINWFAKFAKVMSLNKWAALLLGATYIAACEGACEFICRKYRESGGSAER